MLDPTDEEARLFAAATGLAPFCQFVDPRYEVAEHHKRLIERLEAVERGTCRRLIINMPPRHGKSLTTTTYFPAWFLGRHPDDEVIIASYGASLAEDFSRACRNVLAEHGKTVFGVRISDDSKAVDQWRLKGRYGGLNAAGVDGALTGKGAKLLIIDDPHKNAAEAYSAAFREQVRGFYTAAARTRLAPRGAIVVIQTRWHEDDLTGWLVEEMEKGGESFEVLNLPFVREDGELLRLALEAMRGKDALPAHLLDRDLRSELLWPEQFGDDYGTPRALAKFIRAIGTQVFFALYQGRPTPDGGNVIKSEWTLNRWRAPGVDGVDLPGARVVTLTKEQLRGRTWHDLILVVDATFKKLEDNDRVCCGVVGLAYPNKFVLDVRWERMGFNDTLAAIKDLRSRWPKLSAILIEDKANGSAIIETLRSKIPGVIAVQPDGGKEARTAATVAEWEAGNVFLPEDAPWTADAVYELTKFPRAKHDDFVDMVTYAIRRLSDSAALAYARDLTEW